MGSKISEKDFRIRLEFISAPPAYPTFSKYMVLVKPEECETIQDLEVLVIRKFGYPSGTVISLSVDGFCLPSVESIYLLSRDDRVQVSVLREVPKRRKSNKTQHNGGSRINEERTSSQDTKRVNGATEATSQNLSIDSTQKKVKRSKKKHELPQSPVNTDSSSGAKHPKDKHIKRKKRRLLESMKSPEPCKRRKVHTAANPYSDAEKKRESKKSPKFHQKQNVQSTPCCNEKFSGIKSPGRTGDHPTSCLEDQPVNPSSVKRALDTEKPDSQKVSSSQSGPLPVISSPSQICKTDQVVNSQTNMKPKSKFTGTGNGTKAQKSHIKFDSSSSSAEEVPNHKPNTPQLSTWLSTAKASINHTKQTWSAKKLKDPGVLTNVSSIYTNPIFPNQKASKSSSSVQKIEKLEKNYSAMQPSTWPPRVGDVIAYKVLELSFDYTPVVSEYKEAKIQQVMSSNYLSPTGVNSIQVELLTPKTTTKRDGGRYEMDFGEEADDELSDKTAVLEWQTLLQPKLVQ